MTSPNPARIEAIIKALNELWCYRPSLPLGRLLYLVDPGFISDPLGYDDDRLERNLMDAITEIVKEDKAAMDTKELKGRPLRR